MHDAKAVDSSLEHYIQPQWHFATIFVSFIVAVIGSFTAVLCMEVRRRFYLDDKSKWVQRHWLLWASAISLGGVGIWTMHFLGMDAMELQAPGTNEPLKMNYHLGKTMGSLVAAILLMYCGLVVASLDSYDEISKGNRQDIALELVKRKVSLNNLVASNNNKSRWGRLQLMGTILFSDPKYIIGGGIIAGTGVVVMHFVGMSAMQVDCTIVWVPGIVAASCIIACTVATIAFWITFRLLALYSHHQSLRFLCSFIMGLAVCGTHYSGMYGAKYKYAPPSDMQLTSSKWVMEGGTATKVAQMTALSWCFFIVVLVIIPVAFDKVGLNRVLPSPRHQRGGSMSAGPTTPFSTATQIVPEVP